MPTIPPASSYLTLINVFSVNPARQQKLITLLKRATEEGVCKQPGFISAILHKSIDGTRVAMYAQWRSRQDYENMRSNKEAAPFLEEALTMASFEPGMYEVVETFLPVARP